MEVSVWAEVEVSVVMSRVEVSVAAVAPVASLHKASSCFPSICELVPLVLPLFGVRPPCAQRPRAGPARIPDMTGILHECHERGSHLDYSCDSALELLDRIPWV